MKRPFLSHSIIVALALPIAGFAVDKTDPGKSSDAVKEPASTAPARPAQPLRMPNEAEREPGKSSDSVKTPNPPGVQRQFSGAITAVSRDEKTIIINDATKASHKLHIGDTTKMKRGAKDATWDDLKVGAKVDGTCSGDADDSHAETINING
jgi:hypothetical protein